MKSLKMFFLAVGCLFAMAATAQNQPQSKGQMNAQKLATTLYLIENFYVDTANMDKVTDDAIVAALKELDPHSAYISKKDVEKANEPLVGSFEGIGVTYQLIRDTITVISPTAGGPSEKVGIMAGDQLIKIDGEDAFGKKVDNEYVQNHLRGKKGSKVTVSVKRGNDPELIDFEIIRDKIPLNSINAAYMLDNHVGYIKLDRFAQESTKEFKEAFAKLQSQGMESLIFDLRGNTGGYLNTAIELVDQFLTENQLIVFTEGTHSPRQEWRSTKAGLYTVGKLIVLIDEGSASASEILSGAIQDHDRGVVIGRRSFGKGLVQRPFNLPDGSQMRLTTSRYHTPSGRCIQRPYENGADDYAKEMKKRLEHGEYYHADSIHFPDSLKFKTDGGRTVYGGGGIMPDIFIPVDTAYNSKLYTNLVRKGALNRFTTDYGLKHRDDIKAQYGDFESYNKNFTVGQDLINGLKAAATEVKVEWDDEQFARSDKFLLLQMKALIARNVWETQQYYQVMASVDPAVQKALEVLGSEKEYKQIIKKTKKNTPSSNTIQTTKSTNNKEMSGADLFAIYNTAVFMIFTSDGWNEYQGSGFFISKDGVAVSNYHVFQGTGVGLEQIKLSDGSTYKVQEIIAESRDDDLIVFKVEGNGKTFNCIPIANQAPRVGEKAYAIGSPRGLENTFSSGEISQIRGDKLLQINVPIDHGSSGGVLLNSRGEAIGITCAGYYNSSANLNFAISINVLKKYVKLSN